MNSRYRQWLYHKEQEPKIFEAGEFIPEGWFDSPDFEKAAAMWFDPGTPRKYVSQMNKEQLLDHAAAHGIYVDPELTKSQIRDIIEKATK